MTQVSLILSLLTAVSAASGQNLQAPASRLLLGAAQPIAKWENGRFLSFDFHSAEIAHNTLSIPGAARVLIYDIAAAPDGTMAIAAGAMLTDVEGTPLLAWLSGGGSIARVVRTGDFVTKFICFSADGNLWALGRDKRFDLAARPSYDTVRVYGSDGRLVRSLLPIESFGSYMELDYVQRSVIHPAMHAQLKASKDRVGLYSRAAGVWIEMALDGRILGRWGAVHAPGSQETIHVALTDSGRVFAALQLNQPVAGSRMPRSSSFVLDKQSGTWTRIDDTAVLDPRNRNVLLYGSDGNRLVMSSRSPEFIWVDAGL